MGWESNDYNWMDPNSGGGVPVWSDVPGVTTSPATAPDANNSGWTWNDTKNLLGMYGGIRMIDSQANMVNKPTYMQNTQPLVMPDGSVYRQQWVKTGAQQQSGGMMWLLLAGLAAFAVAG